jgi:sirohydrochlorin ferrochelatase
MEPSPASVPAYTTGREPVGPDPVILHMMRARVPDEIRALRERLEELRRQPVPAGRGVEAAKVRELIDRTARDLDDLTQALIDLLMGDGETRHRQGHRSSRAAQASVSQGAGPDDANSSNA